jgi:hypothetical protein
VPLHLYVGSLTRYYTISLSPGGRSRDGGPDRAIVGGIDHLGSVITNPATIEAAIVAWRQALACLIQDHLQGPLDWEEGLNAPHFVEELPTPSHTALVVWAAHDECAAGRNVTRSASSSHRPDEPWVIRREGPRSLYPALYPRVEAWLPLDFPFTLEVQDLSGGRLGIGSLPALRRQLLHLNQRSWGADRRKLAQWRRRSISWSSTDEQATQRGLASMLALSEQAISHQLPMLLDCFRIGST